MVTNVSVPDPHNLSQLLYDDTYVDRHSDHDILKAGDVSQQLKDLKYRRNID